MRRSFPAEPLEFVERQPLFPVPLSSLTADAEPFALAGIVVTEILQGLKRDVSRIEHFLSQWEILETKGFPTYREAGRIFRSAFC